MAELLQQIVNGLSLGSIYALIALGYTMVYGILKLINFAHGEVFMMGAYAGYYTAGALGVQTYEASGAGFPLLLALLISLLIFQIFLEFRSFHVDKLISRLILAQIVNNSAKGFFGVKVAPHMPFIRPKGAR